MRDRPKAKIEGVVTERIDDELVVYDGASQTAHCLSHEAASVWEHCDGSLSHHEIAERLARPTEAVERALSVLDEAGLLDAGPIAEAGYSRREAAARLAKVGGVAFAAPLVYSVAVPSMAAALSPFPACGSRPEGCTATQVPINGTHTAVGSTAPGGCASIGNATLCNANKSCGNFVNPSCCHGICASTSATSCGPFICSTQYMCVLGGATCPSATATCAPGVTCCSPGGKPVSCTTGGAGANFGCCSGMCGSNGRCV